MDSNYVLKVTCSEHSKLIDAEQQRQNKRIDILEKKLEDNTKLLLTVQRLAHGVENVQNELISQGKRLESIESRDGDAWRNFKWLLVGAGITLFITVVGFYITNAIL